MAGQGRHVLGIDISANEIRVVEVRGAGTAARIVRAGTVPTPRGALEGDRIAFPEALAETLRGLLNRMNVGTRQAVMGVGAQSVITRIIDIPRVPDTEVRMVIEGELAHYQILREGTGAFDYHRLHDPDRGRDVNPQVLLMAAEEKVVNGCRETAERAGLQLIALEPVLLGMYRAAFAHLQSIPAAVCISVAHSRSEIAIVDHGNIRLYRRVDIGGDDLVGGRQQSSPQNWNKDSQPVERVLLGGDDEPSHAAVVESGQAGAINNAAAGNLATELQRSLDYYRREFPQATTVSRIIVSTNDPEASAIAGWLKEALRIDVTVAEPPISIGTGRAIASQLEAPGGLRFLAASGLAMQGLPGLPASVPSFDLTVRDFVDANVIAARRKFTFSLAASLALMLIGVVIALTMSRNANALEHQVVTRRTELGGKELENQQRIIALDMQQNQLRALRLEGFPFPRLMDAVATAIDQEAGLTEVGLDRSGRLMLTGEASNEKAIIKTREALNMCPYFVNTSLDSFEWVNSGATRLLRFQISSQLAGTRGPAAANGSGQSF